MSRISVAGAGVAGLTCAVRLAEAGHDVVVYEKSAAPGGKCGLVTAGGFTWDSGPSLLTMPWVFEWLELDLERVEPVTRYEFADGTSVELSADLPRAIEALEAWSPGAGADWTRFLGVCAGMWRASLPFLTGPPPWPPQLDVRGDPRDLLRVKPWHTLRTLARGIIRDPRLRMVVERFATYAGADPRRAPAALAVAGYVEHAFGAWFPRGGMYEIVRALVRRLEAAGGDLRLNTPAPPDVTVSSVPYGGDSLSGFALMLGVEGRAIGHHTIRFPADYGAEFDDVFVHRRPVRDPTLYISAPDARSWFVLVNAPVVEADWRAYGDEIVRRLGVSPVARVERTPLEYGPIYGRAPHGRLGTLKRPGNRDADGVWRVGGTVHPGGGLPLVMLGAQRVADEIAKRANSSSEYQPRSRVRRITSAWPRRNA
jgi:phytoene dehydrogenase-like protein